MTKIIFVEDEPTLQKTLGDVLRKEGYDVKAAFDGVAGLELIKLEKPDLVLLDLILPKMDGFTVLKKMREDEETKDIPVMILTNLEGTFDVERVLELGATTYLVKANYELREVVEKIKKMLEK
ncbi:MAG: response regulator [Candidatus Portnoybacteria bacterium CG09_land_8_20_14_0_10_44_13]|uniref:Response regulator n=2 Tax=Candidatus Portnoyibacteriota TaxID=1817913 RepID=A0A2H0KSP3_9BACT|nr:MAG: response regulator [Candidatus Portnoybacteria bacterium CG11_big_fil_rev_8_21_14_0_20_44_10]PIS16688.1 MAG: response regulator [Candidatus Portnoybacteria bacterium CG09_land_8_20_14_0_10_44_13]